MPAGSAFLIKEGMLSKAIRNVDRDNDGVAEYYMLTIRNQILHAVHPLGWIRKLILHVDGRPVPTESVFFVVRGQWICLEHMPTIKDIFWRIGETALIYVKQQGGISKGKHDVECIITASTLEDTSILDERDEWPPRITRLQEEMQTE